MSPRTLNGVRTLLVVITALVGGVLPVGAQQSEPSSASLERIRAALQSPSRPLDSEGVPLFAPNTPDELRLGVLTFRPPDTPGQVVSVRVPVGALVTRAAHSIAAPQHRRAENAARLEVSKALADFLEVQPR